MAFISEMSCCLRVSKADTAAFNAGMATANCSSHSSYNDHGRNKRLRACTNEETCRKNPLEKSSFHLRVESNSLVLLF